MESSVSTVSSSDRARLALKGKILYGKYCGTGGQGICAESFALYHLWQGNAEVAIDLLSFLETEIESLKQSDPAGRLPMTEQLAARLRGHLENEGVEPPDPSERCSILKAKKRPLS